MSGARTPSVIGGYPPANDIRVPTTWRPSWPQAMLRHVIAFVAMKTESMK